MDTGKFFYFQIDACNHLECHALALELVRSLECAVVVPCQDLVTFTVRDQ